nr:putative ribonuclease H-like domain-containing protein [Tanacetum cinerariifolium]GEW02082.1 putative ribonuclease H-like domain-containing protein [Tanacetum cinerariifolium]
MLLAIPDEHLLKYGIKDAKTLWEANKTRFGGNKESTKMQKTILKQQYKNFAASRFEGLDKTYDRFQKLISQLEIHGEVISQEDENLKLLRSLPPALFTHTLIMRNKYDLDTLSMDDLHNNLKLDNEDLEQIDTYDLEEMDLKWQSYQAEEEPTDFALVAFLSSGSSNSDTGKELCFNSSDNKLREMGKMLLNPQHAGFRDQQEMLLIISPKTVDRTCLKDLTMKQVLPYRLSRLMVDLLHLEEVLKENRVFVTKPHNKTPYELLIGRSPNIDFMKPFGCLVTILNTLDHLGKFDGKVDEGFLVGYSVNRRGPEWLFDIDSLKKSINYEPVIARNQTNDDATIVVDVVSVMLKFNVVTVLLLMLFHLLLLLYCLSSVDYSPSDDKDADEAPSKGDEGVSKGSETDNQESMPSLEETSIFDDVYDDREVGAEADTNNLNFQQLSVIFPQQEYPSWIEAMQEELLQFKLEKDERGNVVRNKARLVAQGHTQEEGIYYDEVFTPVAKIEAIKLFLDYASFMRFIVYQMDVKSAFLYDTIKEEVYVCQPPGFEDPHFPNKVYKVEKALYGLYQAPRSWYETLSTYLLENGFKIGLQTTSTPMEPNKALIKDAEAEDVDVHLYRSMIRSLMYLIASRPDIMFDVYACARDSPFDLEAFSDSDYAGASLDRKSTIRGCQFLGKTDFMAILNGCLDWIETSAKHEIQVSSVGLPYYWLSKVVWVDLVR